MMHFYFRESTMYALIKKIFTPHLEPEAPLFQLVDMPMGLNVDLKGIGEEQAKPLIKAKLLECQYMEGMIKRLDKLNKDKTEFPSLFEMSDLSHPDAFVRITARNYLLSYIDSNFQQLKFLAGKKDETVEETIEKLQKNSNK